MPLDDQEHIESPVLPIEDRDRSTMCDQAMRSSFRRVVARAEAAGWNGDEASLAMLRLSLAHLKARRASRDGAAEALRTATAELASVLGPAKMVDALIRHTTIEAIEKSKKLLGLRP